MRYGMSSRLDGNEGSRTRQRFRRVTFTQIPAVPPSVEEHKKRQFKRPGDFKPDPISLHGFHELSYLTPQNIHTVTDLFEFDNGVDLADPSTATSLPVMSMSPMPSLSHLPSAPSMPPLPPVPKYTDPLLSLSYTPPEMTTVLPSTGQLLAASRKPAAPSGLQAFLKRPLVQGIAGLAVGIGFLV